MFILDLVIQDFDNFHQIGLDEVYDSSQIQRVELARFVYIVELSSLRVTQLVQETTEKIDKMYTQQTETSTKC